MPAFPSQEWMEAYAQAVATHQAADALSTALEGRYRFVITEGGGFATHQAHDLVVQPGGQIHSEVSDYHRSALLTVTADYPRWKGLIAGTADFMMSFLMRRITVEGNIMGMRERINDVAPLVDCLRRVPTTFEH